MNIRPLRCLLCCLLVGLAVLLGACSPATSPPAEEAAAGCELGPVNKDMACTMEYDPVCGCDGKTYSNACVASVAGVPSSEPGACEGDDQL